MHTRGPLSAIFFTSYNYLENVEGIHSILNHFDVDENSSVALRSIISASLGVVITQPIDVVRTKYQVQGELYSQKISI